MIARWLAICSTVIIFLALVWRADPLAPPPPEVEIDVYPPFAMAPASFRVRAIIEPHPDNRALFLNYESAGTFKSSYFQIDGAQRQRVFQPTNACACWLDLPSGEYVASATLIRMTQGRARTLSAHMPFRVLGGF